MALAWRKGGHSLVIRTLVAAASAQACSLLHSYPDPPATTYRPTLVGVIAELSGDQDLLLADGRKVNLPDSVKGLGGPPRVGSLYLEGNDPERWEFSLAPSRYSFFQNRLELPKAAGFQATTQPENVDGRSAWAFISGGVSGVFCVNEHGEVAFGGSGEPSSASPSRS